MVTQVLQWQVLANQGLAQVQNPASGSQEANFSDTTASPGASDDEGSTAATDGSTLRTSPAEQVNTLLYRTVDINSKL